MVTELYNIQCWDASGGEQSRAVLPPSIPWGWVQKAVFQVVSTGELYYARETVIGETEVSEVEGAEHLA